MPYLYIYIDNKYSDKSKLHFKFLFLLKTIGIGVLIFCAAEIDIS